MKLILFIIFFVLIFKEADIAIACASSRISTRKEGLFKIIFVIMLQFLIFCIEESRLRLSICKVTGTIECNKYCREGKAYKGYCHDGSCLCVY